MFTTSTSQDASVPNSWVQVPMRPYTAARSVVARSRATRRIVSASMPHTGATTSGEKSRASRSTSSSPVDVALGVAELHQPLGDDRVHDAEQEVRVGARPDEEVLVGLLRGLRPARVDHDEPAAAGPDRPQPTRARRARS